MKPIIERVNKRKTSCSNALCRNKIKGGKFCASCRSRICRMKDPVKYSYQNKKSRAGQRKSKKWPNGIPFTITLEEFREFCYETEYIGKNGQKALGYDCDRKDEDKGYVSGNLQKLLKGDNVRKYHYHRKMKKLHYDWATKTAVAVEVNIDVTVSNLVTENKEEYF